ncbi:MAG: hypothetical protein ACLVAW_21560 [Eisenbergiella massiliensis]
MRIQQQGLKKWSAAGFKVINFDNELGRINAGLRFHVLNGKKRFSQRVLLTFLLSTDRSGRE